MSGPITESNGQIVPKGKNQATLANLVDKMKGEIARALPKHIDPDRMARVATTALRTVKNLDACDAASFLGCLLQCSQLGLEPNTLLQEVSLIPRLNKNTNRYECTLIIGYQGHMTLARRSGQVNAIFAFEVREGDEFTYELGLAPSLTHKPSGDADREDKPITYVYAVAKLLSGETQFVALSRAQVLKRKARGAGGPAWKTDEAEMFKKTAIRALTKYLPRSTQQAQAEAIEQAVDDGRVPPSFDLPEETARALLREGVIIDAETGETVDPETGEVMEKEDAA